MARNFTKSSILPRNVTPSTQPLLMRLKKSGRRGGLSQPIRENFFAAARACNCESSVAVAEAWRVGELYHSPRDEQRGAVLIAHTLRRIRCYAVHIIPQFDMSVVAGPLDCQGLLYRCSHVQSMCV